MLSLLRVAASIVTAVLVVVAPGAVTLCIALFAVAATPLILLSRVSVASLTVFATEPSIVSAPLRVLIAAVFWATFCEREIFPSVSSPPNTAVLSSETAASSLEPTYSNTEAANL